MDQFEPKRCLYNARANKLAIYGGVNVKRPKVTYEVLMAAKRGDADAELSIMDAYVLSNSPVIPRGLCL